jgi:hypothetical protein
MECIDLIVIYFHISVLFIKIYLITPFARNHMFFGTLTIALPA